MITPQEVEDVLNYFYNNNDNRSGVIAKKLNISVSKVNKIIEVHLSHKRNYMPSKKVEPPKRGNYKNMKPLKVYENDILIGEFASHKLAGDRLGVPHGTISKGIRHLKECIQTHISTGKTYKYVNC